MNINDVIYVGIFIDHIQGTLSKDIPNQHITLSFRPDEQNFNDFLEHIGETCEISVIGYDNDGKNEGLLVDFPDNIPYYGAKKKHITLSTSDGSFPVKTGFLTFDKKIPSNIANQLPETLVGRVAVLTNKRGLVYDADLFNCSMADIVLNTDKVEPYNVNNSTSKQQKIDKNNDEKEICR